MAFVNTTGNWKLDDEQKQALLAFVPDDGKRLVLAHAAIDANYDWRTPWGTFDAP